MIFDGKSKKPSRTINVTSYGRKMNLKPAGLIVLKYYTGIITVLLGLSVVKKLFYLNNFFYQQNCNCLIPAGRAER
nr:MAG TPA: hypothetical protein [Caudoviricetes sp.]